jgi:D-alanyl-D-alanine carboxypeptidase (penicillin-binding protein 5/6)
MRKSTKVLAVIIVLILIIGGYSTFAVTRSLPIPKISYNNNLFQPVATGQQITWPNSGESAVGVVGSQILDTHNTQTPEPTASTAKLVTALMVLRAKPLSFNQPGPTITLTQNDVNIYNAYIAEDGSVVSVEAGEQISEYQLLEAMLIPSANNVADSLADWAYGSLPNYEAQANKYVASLGLTGTNIGSDASGFSPTTVSTAHDLVKIGEMIMQQPVLAQIVSESSASNIPVVGTITNYNNLLGSNNVVGIKTGNTDQAGGVFVGASKPTIGGQTITMVTAYMQAPTLQAALTGSLPLITSSQSNYQQYTLVTGNEAVATMKLPWQSKKVSVVADSNLNSYAWGGGEIDNTVNLNKLTYPTKPGQIIGQAVATGNASLVPENVTLSLDQKIENPPLIWRLLHP